MLRFQYSYYKESFNFLKETAQMLIGIALRLKIKLERSKKNFNTEPSNPDESKLLYLGIFKFFSIHFVVLPQGCQIFVIAGLNVLSWLFKNLLCPHVLLVCIDSNKKPLPFLYALLCIYIFSSTCFTIFSFITVFQQCDWCAWVYLYPAWHLLNFLGLQIYNFHQLGKILAMISPNNFSHLFFSPGIPTTHMLRRLILSPSWLLIFSLYLFCIVSIAMSFIILLFCSL